MAGGLLLTALSDSEALEEMTTGTETSRGGKNSEGRTAGPEALVLPTPGIIDTDRLHLSIGVETLDGDGEATC